MTVPPAAEPVFLAANPVEAEIVKDYLGAHGIRAEVRGRFAWGALGELPFTEAYPRLYLENESDRARALELIRTYEKNTGHATHLCTHCGEASPENFPVCWNCGGSYERLA